MLINTILRIIRRLRAEYGGIVVPFAILIPILLIFVALGVNSARMFIAKNRLADTSAEVGLMVSASSVVNGSKQDEKALSALAKSYVEEFFPDIVGNPLINITYSEQLISSKDNTTYMTFQPQLKVTLPFPYYASSLSGGDKNFTVSSPLLTVKKEVARPIDVVFIVDFSTSQKGARMRILKAVFQEVTQFILASNEYSRIAIVPFSTGVAVKYPETNQRGGAKAGCSVLFVPKKAWAIDYSFWGDKYVDKKYSKLTDQTYHMDNYRKLYYLNYVGKSTPTMSNSAVLAKWCRKNPVSGTTHGKMDYSCFDDRLFTLNQLGQKMYYDDIFSPRSLDIITREYHTAVKVRDQQYKSYTIEHDDSIDYEATLTQMFGNEAIITFPMLWSPVNNSNFRSYSRMCQNTGGWNSFGYLANARLRSWLIELTNQQKALDQFQDMEPDGWTATTSGLIRSVPVMMKGSNPRKIFVIMSDGLDSASPAVVTDKYLKKYALCERIRQGMIDRPETKTERVDIYYISTTDDRNRVKYWTDNCTGDGNAALATDRKSIVSVIKGFISDEIGTFTHE